MNDLILYTTEDGELEKNSVTEDSSVVQIEGSREVQRPVSGGFRGSFRITRWSGFRVTGSLPIYR